MINSMTSDSAAEELTDHPGKPWLELDFQEPGVHLTHQGLEMTSAWSFPIGSTLKVGITCPNPDDKPAQMADPLVSPTELAPHQSGGQRRSKVHATGVVISCEPSAEEEGNYQLTIYFLDHLANLMGQEAANEKGVLVDEPTVGPWFAPGPNFAKGVTHGPGAACFGLEMEAAGNNPGVPPFGLGGVLPFFLGA